MSFCAWFGSEHYRDHFKDGTYNCSECLTPLFDSTKKYDHSSPWPAFCNLIDPDLVNRVKESPMAIKISCAKCGNSLGHEFINDGPQIGAIALVGKVLRSKLKLFWTGGYKTTGKFSESVYKMDPTLNLKLNSELSPP